MKHIDPHVHCRDWDQSYKATIKSVMDTARRNGVVAIVDMPNTQPPIISRELVERRLKTAEDEGCIDGYYMHIGVTPDAKQIEEAVEIARGNRKVVAMKMYAGKSVGNLEISQKQKQAFVYKKLAQLGYDGVIMLHCEREDMFNMGEWNPSKPYTWNVARPPIAEVESVRDQIELAIENGFIGHLHICHISVPEAVGLVDEARAKMSISCGVTPHHLTLSTDDMQTVSGMTYKVNPPIRERAMMLEMRRLLKAGKIDIIETDHAPHSTEEKTFGVGRKPDSYMSGIPSLENYAEFIEKLRKDGFSEAQIEKLTYSNVKGIFKKIVE